jgi:hypothetical protein
MAVAMTHNVQSFEYVLDSIVILGERLVNTSPDQGARMRAAGAAVLSGSRENN